MNCFAGAVSRYGETYTISGLGHTGLFDLLPDDDAVDVLTSTQISAAKRPLWRIWVAHGDTTAVSDTVVWQSTNYNVLKVIDVRLYGTTQLKQVVIEEI